MARPLVALVGRPNTGKSTLFNRLVGWRQAIVDKEPGLTRDRLYGTTDWEGREMTVIDTAGLDVLEGLQSSDPAEQTRLAIEQADVIVLLLDARQGLTPIDRDIAEMLRRSGRPVVVGANKADQHGQQYLQHELYELGLEPVVPLSGQHGVGVDDLLDAIVERLPPPPPEEEEEDEVARIAIMGRPNVGKSSLLNRLLGDERALVAETPGTTRDPVDTQVVFDGLPMTLIDTAGIRRRAAARDRAEHFSLLRGINAMERSDCVLLVLDGPEGVLRQDQHVASYALEAGKGLVVVVNKLDLLEGEDRQRRHWQAVVQRELRFAPHVPVVVASARTGRGTQQILPTALEVVGQRHVRVPTSRLNQVLREAFLEHPPPSFRGKRLNLKYATQARSEAPTIVLFVNDTELLHFSYRRYLENRLRAEFGFAGNPLRLVLRASSREGERAARR
ncbi:MAG: ribosome biogenesis GTPase Der [Candidatus Dormibacteraeota bacterium]|nr:ribosome biogenesis GTPase Der [Candidatus Dormibacteraeota bacterium]